MGNIAGKYQLQDVLVGVKRYLLVFLCLFCFVPAARGEEEGDDLPYLELFNGTIVESVSADRSPRPASQTAENITVVTAKDIEALNAHTLADVLYTVTGVQLEQLRTPGTISNIEIQGSIFNHILVMLDNVPINNLNDNYPDIASVPARIIDRVEIVKGAASSSWGNALGGVVNVITKSPQGERPFAASALATIGERGTAELRGEVSGTVNRVGYYMSGGKLRSSGLLPNNDVDLDTAYGKFTYDFLDKGAATLTVSFSDSSSGVLSFAPSPALPQFVRSYDAGNRQLIATLSLQRPITDRITMEGVARTRQVSSSVSLTDVGLTPQPRVASVFDDEESYGASYKLSYLDELQRIAAGVDYDHVQARVPVSPGADLTGASDDRVGIYINDTLTLGHFAVTPSARFDHSDIGGDLFSPSLGVTYAVTDNTVLRGYTARGYSLTSLVRKDATEKVWTSQIGFESADIPFLWLKGTAFRNDTWNILVQSDLPRQRQMRRGFELEARTLPVLYTSLSLGYTYIDAFNQDTGAVRAGVPRHTLNLGIKYEDNRNLRLHLFGHYIDWNIDAPLDYSYRNIIWDLYLGKKVTVDNFSVELFASIRNLFNGNQYLYPYTNPRRWAEVGLRCAF